MQLVSFHDRSATRKTHAAYTAGEVVKLKSGGRPMTATWSGPVLFAPGTWLICQWFSDAGELLQEMFPEETLMRAQDALAG
jgi:uncharacterized protein YodC (DUF2158 family)